MTSTSNKPGYTHAQVVSIKIGRAIHADIVEDARRETASRNDGSIVYGYLDHDLIGSGKLPFLRYDTKTGKISRTFSKDIAERIRDHREDLKVYFDYVIECDRKSVSEGGVPV